MKSKKERRKRKEKSRNIKEGFIGEVKKDEEGKEKNRYE